MNCIILSPKTESRKAIEKVISKNNNFKILKSVAGTDEARDVLLNDKVDVVFIEITQPGMDGWGLFEDLPHSKPHKIFLSTQKELAKDAFDYDGSDFILLPLTQLSLLKSLTKLMKSTKNIFTSSVSHDFIFIRSGKIIVKLIVKEILYIEAMADYITINTVTKKYTVHSTMKGMLDKLPPDDFVRVHKSFIVRLENIQKIEPKKILIDRITIPLSRAYRKELMEKIDLLH